MNRFIFIRTDANTKIGSGHLSRCLILAEELKKRNNRVIFLLHKTDKPVLKQIEEKGFKFIFLRKESAEDIIEVIGHYKSDLKTLLFDTDLPIYFDPEAQLKFINHSCKVVFFTFWNNYQYLAHIIINQNPLSLGQEYHTADYTKKLLGPDYMIFNDRIIELSQTVNIQSFSYPSTILISFGGSDLPDRTLKTIKAIQLLDLSIKKINIIIGSLYPHEETLLKYLSGFRYPFNVFKQTNKMAEIMSESDMAICAGGLTLWELALFNIPTAIITYTKRENLTADFLHRMGLGYHLGSIKSLSCEELSQKITKFVGSKEARETISRLKEQINPNGKTIIANEINNLNLHD